MVITGIIIIDGNGCLYGKLEGINQYILHRIIADLPRTMGRGSQRFQILRLNKRIEYIKKCHAAAIELFTYNNNPTIENLVIAGTSLFKGELKLLIEKDMLYDIPCKLIDISYGMEYGFNLVVKDL